MSILQNVQDYIKNLKFSMIILPVFSILLALIFGSILIISIGVNPIEAYKYLFTGAFGSWIQITETLVNAIPLIFTGLAITIAFRASIFNIGAEGQLYFGAVFATWAGVTFSLPIYIHLPFAILMGFIGGMIWGAIPGILNAKKGLNIVIVTLLMNYIAIHFTDFLLNGPLQQPGSWNPQSSLIESTVILPIIFERTSLHAGLILALALAVIVYIFLWKSTLGFKLRMVGGNKKASENAGVSIDKTIILTMLLSGGIAGIAGAVEILGKHHRLITGFSPEYGFDAIAVAIMGRLHPLGVIIAAIFFGGLRAGASVMQTAVRMPVVAVSVIQGLVILFIVAGTAADIDWSKIFKKGGGLK